MTELPPNPLDPDENRFHLTPPRRSAAGARAAAVSLRRSIDDMGVRRTARTLAVINQPEGFDCPGCAWPEAAPGERHHIEFCENGAKAVAEEATTDRVEPIFFAEHSVADLATRSDYWLGQQGRITHPMVKRPGATNYTTIEWDEAFALVADELHRLDDPDEAVFYTSGRTSNEAAFAYQLLVRAFGTNNLPDCSNMCHEATGVALGAAIGIGKGSVRLEDFVEADVILVVGQNPGTNHPRMLGTLGEAKAAGATIVAINPLPEAGLLNFKNPQRPSGIIGSGTALADLHLPIRLGGDQALFQLWSQRLLRRDAEHPGAIDRGFIDGHTHGFEQFAAHIDGLDADALLAATGLDGQLVDEAFEIVAGARRMIVCWAMGITQHRNAVETIREIINFAFLGGHIGRPGAGLCPVRGHSNVQGDRTMGIWEQPSEAFLDRLAAEFPTVDVPRRHGLDVADAIAAFMDGRARTLFCLGGNFLRAIPDTAAAEEAIGRCRLTVHVSTKLNRSHAICGDTALILPTLGRTERDRQLGGDQFVTVEDSMGKVHRSTGVLQPASPHLRSEMAIVTGVAEALLGHSSGIDWAAFRHDYSVVREHISRVVPGFEDFNERIASPAGFELPHPPRDHRTFPTPTGAANFAVTDVLAAGSIELIDPEGPVLLLQTLRSHDQYNTTIYGLDDRYRGVHGGRLVVFVNEADIARLGLADGQFVDLVSHFDDVERRVRGFRIVAYPTPVGCVAAYYPETNPLIALGHRSIEAGTPASKSVPVTLEPTAFD